MARLLFGLVCWIVPLSGCALHAAAADAKPPAASEPRTEAVPQRNEPAPKLIAPPPAYGNKIVLAQAQQNVCL